MELSPLVKLLENISEINPIPTFPSYLRSILILSTYLQKGIPSGLLPSELPTYDLCAFLFTPFMLHALPISSILTSSFWLYLAKSTSYEASHYAISSTFLTIHLSSVQIQNHRQNCSRVYANLQVSVNSDTFSNHLFAIFMSGFEPSICWRDSNIYLAFSISIPRPTSLQVSITVSVFSL
jgi:hypothetical protein